MSFATRQYQIGTGQPGAPRFQLALVFGQDQEVSGRGTITQATNPPLDVQTSLFGHAMREWIVEGLGEVIVLTGYSNPLNEPIGYVNVQCTMLLENSQFFKSHAQLSYRKSPTDPWIRLSQLPVRELATAEA